MAKNTVDVTDATFDSDVLKSDKTVLVDFWAEWCGPCKMVAPVLDEIAGENKEKITVAKLDIDDDRFPERQAGEADRRRPSEGRAALGPGRLPRLTPQRSGAPLFSQERGTVISRQ